MKQIIKNQKLFFISLIGIVVVSLVMGTTYAYQTLQVDYEEGSSSNLGGNGLQTPKLEVNFNVTCKEGKTCDEENDNYNRINLTNMPLLPDYKAADYTEFTLTNNSTGDVAYQINLTSIIYSPNLVSSDFKYTITEIVDGTETVKFEGDFSTLSSTSFLLNPEKPYNYLEKDKSKTIRIYLWLQETEANQNGLENTAFQGVLEIDSVFEKISFKLVDEEGNDLTPEYITSIGTTFEKFLENNNAGFIIDSEDNLISFTDWENQSGSIPVYSSCTSPSGTYAYGNSIIENGIYDCRYISAILPFSD